MRGTTPVVILSEVLTNTAVHGSAERVRLVLGHTPAGLRGEVHELGSISGHVAPRAGALAQMRALASGGVIPVEDLPESGRGLAMLSLYCGEDGWGVARTEAGRVVWFVKPGCRCQVRVAHPQWGTVPGLPGQPWLGVRHGYPLVQATGPEELIAAIREAEGLRRATARRFRPPG